MSSDPGIAVVRRNTEEVQGRGNFEVFEELFAFDFVDHTPQPGGFTPDRDGARNLYRTLRAAFPDFHAEIHFQISDGDRAQGPLRDRRRHARAQRQDHRALGGRESPVPYAATRRSTRLGRYESRGDLMIIGQCVICAASCCSPSAEANAKSGSKLPYSKGLIYSSSSSSDFFRRVTFSVMRKSRVRASARIAWRVSAGSASGG